MPNEDQSELKPLRLMGCVLVGGRFDAAGELIGEENMQAPGHMITIEAQDFARLPEIVEQAAADHVQRVADEAEARAEELQAEITQIPDGG